MPIQGKTTNIGASDINKLLGTPNQTVSLGNIANTWFGNANTVSLGNDFTDTFTGTQDGLKIVPQPVGDDPNDWFHRGLYTGGERYAISRDGSTLAIAKAIYGVHIFKWNGTAWVLDNVIRHFADVNATYYTGVALNADGTTIAFGWNYYGINPGFDYSGKIVVYTKPSTTWNFQAELVPTGYSVQQYNTSGPTVGIEMCLSDDGNTLAAGGPGDNGTRAASLSTSEGAVYVWTRSGSTWSQQARLTSACRYCGISVSYMQSLGSALSMSSDGNTIAAGGFYDSCGYGAFVIFTRSGSTWSQQFRVEGDYTNIGSGLGNTIALSSDGNTVAVGSGTNGGGVGPFTYIYTRSGSTWSLQTTRNLFTDNPAYKPYPTFMAMSNDGNTLAIGANNPNGVLIYTRSGSTWSYIQTVYPNDILNTSYVGQNLVISGDASKLIFLCSEYGRAFSHWSRSGGSYVQYGNKVWIKPAVTTTQTKFGVQGMVIGTDESTIFVSESAYVPNGSMTLIPPNKIVGNTSTSLPGSPTVNGQPSMSSDGKILIVPNFYMANSTSVQVGGVVTYVKDSLGNWNRESTTIPDDAYGNALFGMKTAISGDGTTLAVIGPQDSQSYSYAGAVWVYVKSGSVWVKQQKILGTAASVSFGGCVSLSNDGNTMVVGNYQENGAVGTVRVYTRSGGVWSLQTIINPTKIGASTSPVNFGKSVSLSGDGNLLAAAQTGDCAPSTTTPVIGTVAIYTRSGTTWTLKASLQANNAIGSALMGWSVSLSGDGYTLTAGSIQDNTSIGAVWVFRRQTTDATSWTQQYKLVPSDTVTTQQLGQNIALSRKGKKLIVGTASKEGVWFFK